MSPRTMAAMDSTEGRPDPLDRVEHDLRRPGGSRVAFREELAGVERELVAVGRMLVDAVDPVTTAFLQADDHAAGRALAGFGDLDRRCVELEERCYVLIARQSPVGGDLRSVVAVLSSVADVQRSANLLEHVSRSLTWVHPPAMPDELRQLIAQLGAVSAQVFGMAVDAWERHDGLAANDLDERDDQVDFLQKCLLTELYTSQRPVEEAVSLALLARYFERIADHGVEMARQVAYLVTGQRVGLTHR